MGSIDTTSVREDLGAIKLMQSLKKQLYKSNKALKVSAYHNLLSDMIKRSDATSVACKKVRSKALVTRWLMRHRIRIMKLVRIGASKVASIAQTLDVDSSGGYNIASITSTVFSLASKAISGSLFQACTGAPLWALHHPQLLKIADRKPIDPQRFSTEGFQFPSPPPENYMS